MSTRVLMIDDDTGLTGMVREYLAAADMQVTGAASVADGLAALHGGAFDVLVLDVMLPDGDGFEVCRQVRGRSAIPILMLTARGEDTDRIIGLELGADDYLAKPFNPRELLARLRALLRRARAGGHEAAADGGVLRFGRLSIDRDRRQVRVDGEERVLTAHQFDLLCALAMHPGRVMSRETLMNRVRGEDLDAFDRSIDVHISRIRAAIEDDPRRPRRVLTLRGAGYLFAREQP